MADSADGRRRVGDVVDTEGGVVDIALTRHWHVIGEAADMAPVRGWRAEPNDLLATVAMVEAKVV